MPKTKNNYASNYNISAKKEEILALEAFLKALKIRFEYHEAAYDADFVAKIKASEEDKKAGRTRTITLDEIWK